MKKFNQLEIEAGLVEIFRDFTNSPEMRSMWIENELKERYHITFTYTKKIEEIKNGMHYISNMIYGHSLTEAIKFCKKYGIILNSVSSNSDTEYLETEIHFCTQ